MKLVSNTALYKPLFFAVILKGSFIVSAFRYLTNCFINAKDVVQCNKAQTKAILSVRHLDSANVIHIQGVPERSIRFTAARMLCTVNTRAQNTKKFCDKCSMIISLQNSIDIFLIFNIY